MQLLPSLLFGISCSLDALLVGIGYGLRGVRIRAWQNLLISLVALLGTCVSAVTGCLILPFIFTPLNEYIGSITLMLLGAYYIIKWLSGPFRSHPSGNSLTDKTVPRLSVWETLVLSITLSLNNLGIGLSAGMAGLTLPTAALTTFSCSALFLLAGNRLGQSRVLRLIENAADPISGILLAGLGILQLTM